MNIITGLIDLAFLIYYSIIIVRNHKYINDPVDGYNELITLDKTVEKFMGIVMCILAFGIWISFFFMYRTFIRSVNL